MSDKLAAAETALRNRLAGGAPDGTIRFEIEGEGVIRIVDGRVTREDGAADVTIAGSLATFREMFEGGLSPTVAYMTGRIRIDGDMGQAIKLGQLLG